MARRLAEVNAATQENRFWQSGVRIGPVPIRPESYQYLGTAQRGPATTSSDDEDLLLQPAQPATAGLYDLIGSWRDERDVEEIVRDIYDSRTI